MTAAAKSVYVFAIYLIVLSVSLIAFPNTLLATFQLPTTDEVWIRVVGVLVFSLSVYYFYMATENNTVFFALSAYVRSTIIVWFTLFVVLGWAPPMLIMFGVVDLLAAIWTFVALRNSKQ
jgi:hypothetical protein